MMILLSTSVLFLIFLPSISISLSLLHTHTHTHTHSLSLLHTHTHTITITHIHFFLTLLCHTLSLSHYLFLLFLSPSLSFTSLYISIYLFFTPYSSLLFLSQSIFFSLPIPLFSFYLNLSFFSPYFSISHTLHPYMTHYCTAIVSFPFSNGFLGIMDKAMINVTDTLEAVADSIFTYGENVVHLVR